MSVVADKTFKIPQNDNSELACLPASQNAENFKFSREDWHMFRSINSLPQKAGVPLRLMRRLVLKELVDNALDAGQSVTLREEGDTYIIEDDGPGIDGDPEDIALLFSISRPLMSSKMWRLPTRGALGNGLRVAVGSVLCSRGKLAVVTRNRRHVLTPRDDGTTTVDTMPADMPNGTRIEIGFGPDLPADAWATRWGTLAIQAARGETYAGKSSPFWYDPDHFFDLLRAAGNRPVRALVEELDGCSGAKAGTIAAEYKGRPCNTMDRDEATSLLGVARAHAKAVNAKRLGAIGPEAFHGSYAVVRGEVDIGARNPRAIVPFVVEVWAELCDPQDDSVTVDLLVNRTPVAADVEGVKHKKDISIFGCGLSHRISAERGTYRILISVISPVVPITTDGKEPDLLPFLSTIADTVTKAIRKSKKAAPTRRARSQKDIVLENLEAAVVKNSGGGQFSFPQRNVFYVVREFVHAELGKQLEYKYFQTIIDDYEDENGGIPGMTRDPRGTLYTPHLRTSIPIGTTSVELYERPKWTFNKVLFIEKEGFFETLKAIKWPERYDCALLTSKGFSSRACRDLIDSLAEDVEEDLTVFCVHDADAFGTMIHQTLQEATKARGHRKVEIVNFGLEPWEAREMGLQPDSRGDDTTKKAPVADYVRDRPDGAYWASWLQERRFELNAMSMPQFIAWLDGKMAEHGVEKVVPPASVVLDTLRADTEFNLRESLQRDILARAGLEDQLADAMEMVEFPGGDEIEEELPMYLDANPTDRWTAWVNTKVHDIVGMR